MNFFSAVTFLFLTMLYDRLPGWTDSGGEGSASPASSVGGFGAGVETPPEPTRPAPVLDRRDSNRSLTGRLSRRDSSKVLCVVLVVRCGGDISSGL